MKNTDTDASDEGAVLLTRIAARSEAALCAFYEKFKGPVYAFAHKRLRNPADAADVLNEVMLEVWRSAARFEGRARVLTWVLGITHHKTIDLLRKHARDPQEEVDPEMPDNDTPATVEMLMRAEDATQLHRCLDGLSDVHRQIVHLAYFEDLSCEEISAVADCPVGTVKTRLFHARRLLKLCLDGLNPFHTASDLTGNPS